MAVSEFALADSALESDSQASCASSLRLRSGQHLSSHQALLVRKVRGKAGLLPEESRI